MLCVYFCVGMRNLSYGQVEVWYCFDYFNILMEGSVAFLVSL